MDGSGPRVWITRAEPGAQRTALRLESLGLVPVVVPVLRLRDIPQAAPDLSGVSALAFTSPNGVAAFARLSPDRDRPVFAVGDATARAASDAGFPGVRSADGDLGALAALLAVEARGLSILHPCAREPAGDLSALTGAGVRVAALPVYESQDVDFDLPEAVAAVLIHSPRAARVVAARLSPAEARDRTVVAISPAALAPLQALPFAVFVAAPAPNEPALVQALALALGKPDGSV